MTRTRLDDWVFTEAHALDQIEQQFSTGSLKGFGLDDAPYATVAAGVILHYLDATHHRQIEHIQGLRRLRPEEGMWLDPFTVRNLEILHPNHPDGRSLVDVLDRTCTPMGGRALRRALVAPLTSKPDIEMRHVAVDRLTEELSLRHDVRQILKSVGDLERLTSKASSGRINPRELGHIRRGLVAVQEIADLTAGEDALLPFLERLSPCGALLDRLQRELVEDPATSIGKGEVIAEGVDAPLDEVRNLAFHSQEALDAIVTEKRSHGHHGLKLPSTTCLGITSRFGMHTRTKCRGMDSEADTDPSERYITEELKTLETQILSAKEQARSSSKRRLHRLWPPALQTFQH